MKRNSVFDELRVNRLEVVEEEICCRTPWRYGLMASKGRPRKMERKGGRRRKEGRKGRIIAPNLFKRGCALLRCDFGLESFAVSMFFY